MQRVNLKLFWLNFSALALANVSGSELEPRPRNSIYRHDFNIFPYLCFLLPLIFWKNFSIWLIEPMMNIEKKNSRVHIGTRAQYQKLLLCNAKSFNLKINSPALLLIKNVDWLTFHRELQIFWLRARKYFRVRGLFSKGRFLITAPEYFHIREIFFINCSNS